jgi:hypothetical protein
MNLRSTFRKELWVLLAVGLVACGGNTGGENTNENLNTNDNQNLNLNDNQNTNGNQNGECGDGTLDSGELCDEGVDNSDSEPGACRTDCSGINPPLGGRAVLVASSTVDPITIRMEFSAVVNGTNLGLSVFGTRATVFESLMGFGTNVLMGTLSAGVVYGEIVTVTYDEDTGDLVSGNGEIVRWFKKELVDNTVPFGGREVYVRADATGSGDGTSEMSAYSLDQLSSTTVQAGDRINIKAGDYPRSLPVPRSGEPGNLVVYQGYQTTPGDLGFDAYHPGPWETLSGANMPLFDGGNRSTGVGADLQSGKHHVAFRDLQFTRFRTGIRAVYSTSSQHLYFDNIAMELMGTDADSAHGAGFSIVYNVASSGSAVVKAIHVINSYVANCTSHNYWVDGDDSFLYNNRSYSNENASHEWDTDYMFTAYFGNDMVWRKLYAEKGDDPAHAGHGFTFKSVVGEGAEWRIENSLIDDCEIKNVNGAIEFRHSKVRYNLARNVRMNGNGGGTGSGGVMFRDGASFNTVDGCRVFDIASTYYGFITFTDTVEDGGYGQVIEGNVVKNSLFENGPSGGQAIRLGTSDTSNVVVQDNAIFNNTFHGAHYLFRRMALTSVTNLEMTNNLFVGFSGYSYADTSVDSVETYNNYFDFWGANGTPPSGTANLSVDPQLVDAAGDDFHLLPSSPICGSGADLAEVRYDRDGVERTPGSYSIGAYECVE